MLLKSEGDRKGVLQSHHLSALLGWNPFGHLAKDSEGFCVERIKGFLWDLVLLCR